MLWLKEKLKNIYFTYVSFESAFSDVSATSQLYSGTKTQLFNGFIEPSNFQHQSWKSRFYADKYCKTTENITPSPAPWSRKYADKVEDKEYSCVVLFKEGFTADGSKIF